MRGVNEAAPIPRMARKELMRTTPCELKAQPVPGIQAAAQASQASVRGVVGRKLEIATARPAYFSALISAAIPRKESARAMANRREESPGGAVGRPAP